MNTPDNEPILEYLKRRLNDAKGEWPKIAEASGVPYDTIAAIAQGERENPTLRSVQPLLNYFHELDAMLTRLRAGPEHKVAAG